MHTRECSINSIELRNITQYVLHYSVLHLFLSHTHPLPSQKYHLSKRNSMLCALKFSSGNTLLVRQAHVYCRTHKTNYYPPQLSLHKLEIQYQITIALQSYYDESCTLLSIMFPLPTILQTWTLLTHT